MIARARTPSVTTLRGALEGHYPSLRGEAEQLVRRALLRPLVREQAAELGLTRRSFERLRLEFPSVFGALPESTDKV